MTQTTLSSLIQQMKDMHARFLTEGKNLLTDEFQNFFKANPEIKVVKWTQYSPYFNDGEECVFSVNCPVFSNAPDADNVHVHGEYEGDEDGVWLYGDDCYEDTEAQPTADEIKAMDAIDSIIQSGVMEDILKSMFGNHVKITVTPTGIEVDEFDHD